MQVEYQKKWGVNMTDDFDKIADKFARMSVEYVGYDAMTPDVYKMWQPIAAFLKDWTQRLADDPAMECPRFVSGMAAEAEMMLNHGSVFSRNDQWDQAYSVVFEFLMALPDKKLNDLIDKYIDLKYSPVPGVSQEAAEKKLQEESQKDPVKYSMKRISWKFSDEFTRAGFTSEAAQYFDTLRDYLESAFNKASETGKLMENDVYILRNIRHTILDTMGTSPCDPSLRDKYDDDMNWAATIAFRYSRNPEWKPFIEKHWLPY